MFLEKTHPESVARRGPRVSGYYSIVRLRGNNAVKFLLHIFSQHRLFRAEDMSLALDKFKQSNKRAEVNSKDMVMISH